MRAEKPRLYGRRAGARSPRPWVQGQMGDGVGLRHCSGAGVLALHGGPECNSGSTEVKILHTGRRGYRRVSRPGPLLLTQRKLIWRKQFDHTFFTTRREDQGEHTPLFPQWRYPMSKHKKLLTLMLAALLLMAIVPGMALAQGKDRKRSCRERV